MSKDFSAYDTRRYKTLTVTDGYAEWASQYDALRAEQNLLDLPMLDASAAIEWPKIQSAVDLGCGTGRIGAYLAARKIPAIDGVDLSGEMLKHARAANHYRELYQADLCATKLSGPYDAAFCALAACHLKDLASFYAECARIVRPGGVLVLIDFHPYFLLQGIPTHFETKTGETLAIQNQVHLASDHVRAGLAHGWQVAEMQERLIDEAWVAQAPRLKSYLHRPTAFLFVWKHVP